MMRKVIINGKEVKLSRREYVRNYQRDKKQPYQDKMLRERNDRKC